MIPRVSASVLFFGGLILAGTAAPELQAQTLVQLAPGTAVPMQKRAGTGDRMLPMDVTVNGAKSGTWLFLEREGVLYAQQDAFAEWRVRLDPRTAFVEFRGQPYAPLNAIPGFKFKVDFAALAVDITFSPEAFATSDLRRDLTLKLDTSPVLNAVFLNYDVNAAANTYRGASATNELGLITETGISTGMGVLTVSHAGRNLLSNAALPERRSWQRLETTFTRDFPDRNQTLRVGDATTRAGLTGRNAYFGGIQFGTNFALTPGFVRQPLPRLQGISAAPSTVELYVNDVLRQTSNVPTGPFTLDNFPVMTGGGEARLVVRDVLGRETVISQSFLTSAQLLAPGLNDWSLEAGRIRTNLGTQSRAYGARFGALTWARGLTEGITGELRGEIGDDQRFASVGMISALPAQFIGRVALGASRHDVTGSGHLWLAGVEHQGLRNTLSLEFRGASRGLRQLGLDTATPPYRFQAAANWTYASESGSNFGLGAAHIEPHDGVHVSTVSANMGMRIFGKGSIALNATHAIAGTSGTSAGITLTLPLEQQRVTSSTLNYRSGQTEVYAAVTQNPVASNDVGWRILAGEQAGDARAEAGAYYQGRYGVATADASMTRNQRALRLGTKGGLVLTDSKVFATRRVDDSFAVVEVAGHGNVGIGVAGNVLTRTNAQGIALVPRLNAYQPNSIRLDPRELPLSAELDTIEQTVVPAWRSAAKVVFPVRSGRGALIKFDLDDMQPVPPGAIVNIVGDKQTFYVARRGEAFVTGLQAKTTLEVEWNAQRCRVEVTLPPANDDEIPRLGPLVCKGVKR